MSPIDTNTVTITYKEPNPNLVIPPKNKRSTRSRGTNPRALGTNPRAKRKRMENDIPQTPIS